MAARRVKNLTAPMKPESPMLVYDIDKEIISLVDALNSHPWIVTYGSCCGHGEEDAYVDFGVYGLAGLHRIRDALNDAQIAFDEEGEGKSLELKIIFDETVATAIWDDEWIPLSLMMSPPPTEHELLWLSKLISTSHSFDEGRRNCVHD